MARRLAVPRIVLALGAAAILVGGCATSASPSATGGVFMSPTPSPASSASPAPSKPPVGWRELPASGPVPMAREDHTWTVDGSGETAYLFGGRDDASGYGAYADLWAYDLASDTWRQLSGGPAARFGHNAAWVPGVGLVVFAGQGASFFNDLWAYDPDANSWRALPADGDLPVPRYGSCAAVGPDGRLWISHGFTSEGSRFADTRAYDFPSGTWTDETPAGDAPIVRCLHACWWTDADQFTLYGGQTTTATSLGDWWQLAVGPGPGTSAWSQVPTEAGAPVARNLYAAARREGGALVFGGQALDGTYLGDTWQLADDGTHAQLVPGVPGPSPRSGAELVADPERGRVLLFGGKAGASVFGDLWELTLD